MPNKRGQVGQSSAVFVCGECHKPHSAPACRLPRTLGLKEIVREMSIAIFPHMIKRKSSVENMGVDDHRDIKLFKERVEKLDTSQRKYQNIPISTTEYGKDGRIVNFSANTPDVDDVINMAIKFRFFFADKEPTQFEKISNLIRNKVNDDVAKNYIDWLRTVYKNAMKSCDASKSLGHPVTNREIINLWFNSEFFHSDHSKRIKLESVNKNIGECGSLFQLYIAITKCSSHICAFYSVVHKLCRDHEYVYTPNHDFRPNKAG